MRSRYFMMAMVGALGLSGCANWGQVPAWEKGNLAKPSMGFDTDVLGQKFDQHIYASRENSSGGYAVGGGGCGCN